jgi:hypothetical protein
MKPSVYLFAAALFAAALPAYATPPADVADLIGVKEAGAQKSFMNRGYANVGATDEAQYWFNAQTKLCVKAVAVDGKMKAVDSVKRDSCTSLTPADQALNCTRTDLSDADKQRCAAKP